MSVAWSSQAGIEIGNNEWIQHFDKENLYENTAYEAYA
jgi:hypothetical protein